MRVSSEIIRARTEGRIDLWFCFCVSRALSLNKILSQFPINTFITAGQTKSGTTWWWYEWNRKFKIWKKEIGSKEGAGWRKDCIFVHFVRFASISIFGTCQAEQQLGSSWTPTVIYSLMQNWTGAGYFIFYLATRPEGLGRVQKDSMLPHAINSNRSWNEQWMRIIHISYFLLFQVLLTVETLVSTITTVCYSN